MHGFLNDIVIAVIAATATGIIFYLLKQPVIVAYLIAGIIIGPEIGPMIVKDPANISAISEIGLCLLLFIAGLEINIGRLKQAGRTVLVPGIGQFPIAIALGGLFFVITGFAHGREAAYLASACALSSTAIVLKSLQDSRQTDALHGRIALVILVIQDLWAVLALILLPSAGGGILPILSALGKTVLLFGAALLVSRTMMKFVFEKASKTPEMTVAVSIGWCAVAAGSAGMMGLSPALGALAAGIAISIFPYHLFVIDKVQPLRDLFLMLFFVSLGMLIPVPDAALLWKVAAVIGFIIISRFAVIYPLVRIAKGSSRTGFLSSLDLSQVSEFSLVIMMAGVAADQVSKESFSILLYAMAITAICSSYAIRYSHQVHSLMLRLLRTRADQEAAEAPKKKHPIIILGVHRGSLALIESVASKMPQLLKQIIVIDYNAEVLATLEKKGVAGHLGDISRAEVLEQAGIPHASVIVATIPEMLVKGIDITRLISLCRTMAPEAEIIASADFKNRISLLEESGATKVILPYSLAGEECAEFVIKMIKPVTRNSRRKKTKQYG